MKLFTAAVLGFAVLSVVAHSASVKTKVAADSEPFDWKQYVPEAKKRSMDCTGCANMDSDAEAIPAQKLPLNPMVPYLSLKPFLPIKPTFVPPFVDPNYFISKKADMLDTLFKSSSTGALGSKSTSSSMDAKSTYSAQRRLATPPFSPTVKPTIVPPDYWMPMIGGGVVDPSTMFDKKTKFLNTLFNQIASPAPAVVSRAALEDGISDDTEQPLLPPSFWLQFISSFTTPAPPTMKATIVPPGFWIPSSVGKIPASPFAPKIPIVDPSEFIDKKTTFLNELFKTLNTTIAPTSGTTPEPTPDPVAAYKQKVEDFLEKLFSAIINNSTSKRTIEEKNGCNTCFGEHDPVNVIRQSPSKRSVTDEDSVSKHPTLPVDALLNAKDKTMGTIVTALVDIKNDILDTLTELLAKQKEATATTPATPASKKKPGPSFGPGGPFGMGGPFGPWGAALLKTTPKPSPDFTPFQNKVEFLSQMFDTLTKLEKDIADTLDEAVNDSYAQTTTSTINPPTTTETSLLELIKNKLAELANETTQNQSSNIQTPKYVRTIVTAEFPTMATPKPTIVEPSFWIPKTAPGVPVDPSFYMSKTQDFLDKLFTSKDAGNTETAASDKMRSIKMAIHQGYQSLPPGTEELLQAGGGSNSMDHEGGGLKLQADATSVPVIPISNKENHHHHNHHNRD